MCFVTFSGNTQFGRKRACPKSQGHDIYIAEISDMYSLFCTTIINMSDSDDFRPNKRPKEWGYDSDDISDITGNGKLLFISAFNLLTQIF